MNNKRFILKITNVFAWLCCFWFVFGCETNREQTKPTGVGFYYWQTTWKWTTKTQQYLNSLQAKELYVRFFDIDWNEHIKRVLPVAPLRKSTDKQALALPTDVAITPTVFITNRAMYNLPDEEVEATAEKIYQKIQTQLQALFPQHATLTALQLDCDWSGETKEKFFKLCKVLKKKIAPALLSATIRLHQVKYAQKTGVPPIDKGVLMCYNVGKVDGSDTQNSILDIDILKAYAPALASYPLKLDIALPTFTWGVLKRGGRVINLLHNMGRQDFLPTHFANISRNTWRVKKAHYIEGVYVYEDDEIRLEQTDKALLQKAMQEIVQYLKNPAFTLLFYHIHEKIDAHFKIEDLKLLAEGVTR